MIILVGLRLKSKKAYDPRGVGSKQNKSFVMFPHTFDSQNRGIKYGISQIAQIII